MMNSYIRIIMKPVPKAGGGSFSTFASFKLDNISTPFSNVTVKIDTGCSVSTVPLAKFKLLKSMLSTLKSDDILNDVDYLTSYGVETGGRKHKVPKTYNDKMACEALKFKHDVYDFEIGGVRISCNTLYINYDRTGNILIGIYTKGLGYTYRNHRYRRNNFLRLPKRPD